MQQTYLVTTKFPEHGLTHSSSSTSWATKIPNITRSVWVWTIHSFFGIKRAIQNVPNATSHGRAVWTTMSLGWILVSGFSPKITVRSFLLTGRKRTSGWTSHPTVKLTSFCPKIHARWPQKPGYNHPWGWLEPTFNFFKLFNSCHQIH